MYRERRKNPETTPGNGNREGKRASSPNFTGKKKDDRVKGGGGPEFFNLQRTKKKKKEEGTDFLLSLLRKEKKGGDGEGRGKKGGSQPSMEEKEKIKK